MTNSESKDLTLLISQEAILQKIASLAQKIDKIYDKQEIVLVIILKGSICFAADLMRMIKTPFTLETISCQSYGMKGSQRGTLTIQGIDSLDIRGKNVLLLDDIFDTGHTLSEVKKQLQAKDPKTLTSAVLLAKPSKHVVQMKPDHILFSVEDHFVIGYGLDFNEHYRGLSGIYRFS